MKSRVRRVAIFCLALACHLPAWAAELVYINTPQGAERLVGAKYRSQYFSIQPFLESQQNLAFCGPASIAAVLNSLDLPRPPAPRLGSYSFFTQENIFNSTTEGIKPLAKILNQGMTLAQAAEFLKAHGLGASAYYADSLSLEGLRKLVTAALDSPSSRILVNYNRKPLGQAGGGHISPLAAYDEASDSVLLLDVAKFKYPPTWIRLADLLGAMQTTDPESGLSRGLVVAEKR